MDDFRRYPKTNTRQIISFNRYLDLKGEKLFICLDRGILEICRYLLNSRGSWRTSYAVNWGDVGYTLPSESQFQELLQDIAEANLDMSSCEDLNTTLQGILEALQGISAGIVQSSGCGPCGGGSRGAGSTSAAPNPYSQGANPGTPPPGFGSYAQYEQRKCDAANDLVTNLKNDLQGIAALEYVTSDYNDLVLAVIAVLLTPIPYDDIVLLIGLILYAGVSYSYLAEFSTVVFNNSADLICILYNSDNATAAQNEVRQALDDLVSNQGWLPEVADFVREAIVHLTPMDAFNKLFETGPTVSQGEDCSGCGVDFPSTCRFMSTAEGAIITETVLEQDAALAGSDYVWAVGWTPDFQVSFTLESGSLTQSSNWLTGLQTIKEGNANNCGAGNNGSWTREHGTFAEGLVSGPTTTVQFFSSTPFRMRAEIVG